MRTVYLDESGRAGHTEFVGIAGVDAEDAEWAAFDSNWNAALSRHGAPYLHMREFAHFGGPFKRWTEEQRRALMRDCLGAMNDLPVVMFAAGMRSADFYRLPVDRTVCQPRSRHKASD